MFFFSYVLFSNTIFIDSTVNIHQQKRNYSNSYNQNQDETIRYIIDKEQRMAVLFYKYGEEVIKYYMYTNSTDSSFGEKQLINY